MRLDVDELRSVRRLRSELHAAIAAQSVGSAPAWPVALGAVRLAVTSTAAGPELTGTGTGVERVASDLVAIVVQAHADGSLARLGVCANGHCGWAFYDRSRNRTGQWCSMAACGQRQKMRRYRARRRTDDPTDR